VAFREIVHKFRQLADTGGGRTELQTLAAPPDHGPGSGRRALARLAHGQAA